MNTLTEKMSQLPIQGSFLIEVSKTERMQIHRRVTGPDSRKHAEIRGKKFSAETFTAVSAQTVGDIFLVMKITRTA